MENRDKLIQIFKSNSNKEYIEKLLLNFESNIEELDYSLDYLKKLKDFLYVDFYYLIQNSIPNDIKRLEKIALDGTNIENENIRKNIKNYESINIKNVLFTTPNLILYIENSKINIYKNRNGNIPVIELIDNYSSFLKELYSSFQNQNKIQFENDIKSFALNQISEGIDFTINIFGKEHWIEYTGFELFLEKFILFQQNQVQINSPILKQELSQLISGDDEINWISNEPFSKLLENNETVIYEKNSEYLLKFVKLDSFLTTKRKSLINIHKEIINTKNEDFIFKTIPILINQIKFYNQMLLLSINMIVALKNNKMILFYKIYETFDQLGIFNSNWEKSLLNKVDELNLSIKDLITQIQQMEMRLNQKIEDLSIDIQSNIDDMKENVIEEISNIKSLNDGGASSILLLINTFQLLGIRNKLK